MAPWDLPLDPPLNAISRIYFHYYFFTDLVTISGYTVLGLAVRKGKLKIIKCLVIEYSVDVNGECSFTASICMYC